MNLSRLPQEMLANILKYQSYKDVYKLRTLNSYMDSTAKRYTHLKMIPVERLEISKYFFSPICKLSLHLNRELLPPCFRLIEKYEVPYNIESITQKLSEMAQRVLFTSGLCLRTIELGHMMYSIVDNNKSSFKLSTIVMKKFLDMFPKLNTIDIDSMNSPIGSCNSEVLFNAEVLGERKWKSLRLGTADSMDYPQFNDAFLMNVVIYCQNFEIPYFDFLTCFTLEGVIKMIEEKSAHSSQKSEIDIGTLELDDTSIPELENMLDTLCEVNVYEKEACDEEDVDLFKVHFGYSNSSLTFAVKKHQDDHE